MSTFDKREEGFEAKFAHDEELHFMALARRNKLLGAWAAGLMGKKGSDIDAYAASLIRPDLLGQTDDRVVLKVVADLKAQSVERSAQDVLGKMKDLLAKAIADIEAGR
ncbi:MAG: DUF1476 domain-containing protein [Hyphomicrobiales bacterium]